MGQPCYIGVNVPILKGFRGGVTDCHAVLRMQPLRVAFPTPGSPPNGPP